MNAQMGGQQIFVLPEGTLRSLGKDAQHANIAAAKAVGDAVRTTLGPKGMDKMLVDNLGDIVITNDGVTILDEMQIEHPAAKMIVEVAKTQNEEVGDGTTTAAVLAAEFLKKAENLLDQNIHPTVLARGYKLAKEHSLEFLKKMARDVKVEDESVLKNIAITSMTGKSSEGASDHLAKVAVDAVKAVMGKEDGKIVVDTDNIKVEKKQGGSAEDSQMIRGIIIDKEVVHPSMPKSLKGARIALLDSALEIEKTETDAQIQITNPEQMQAFMEQEDKMLKNMADKVSASGCNVLLCQKGIDDVAQHYLAKKGILAARRVKKSDMEALARATGGRVVTSLEDLGKDDLGFGGVASALEVGKVVAGGGAPEAAVAGELRKFAQGYSGREQLAILAFAEAMEVIPRTLAENAGLDPIDILVELRAAHDEGKNTFGVNVFNGKVVDMWKEGVIEPLKIKTQAISSASEAAEMILRIDDVI